MGDDSVGFSKRIPALFLGHGSPMHAIDPGPVTAIWQQLGQRMPALSAVLVISAHWTLDHLALTAMDRPRTIHDFGGFPRALYQVQYPCPGSPELAQQLITRWAPFLEVRADNQWGLDHGAWSLLRYLFPNADVPVLQLSLDMTQPPRFHFELGRYLAALREAGILILGSGNVVHNLAAVRWQEEAPVYPWALEFDQWVRERIVSHQWEALLDWEHWPESGHHSVPTPEHFLPLLTVLGTYQPDESLTFPVSGMELGSISMTGVALGT